MSLSLVGESVAAASSGPLHTTGTDSTIYDESNHPVRLVGFNMGGMQLGGRKDNLKTGDTCGITWRNSRPTR